jgi:hypothetical protein
MNLGFLVIGALLEALSSHFDHRRAFPIGAVICFFFTCFISVTSAFLKLEDKWYRGRAVAESVKTLAWKYMMRVESDNAGEITSPEAKLTADLSSILNEFADLGSVFGGSKGNKQQISPAMKMTRSVGVAERRTTYLEHRIKQQRSWYTSKAQQNRVMANALLTAVVGCQLVAVILAAMSINNPGINFAPILAAASSGLIAWTQLRQYSELAQSYGIAGQDLGLIEEQGTQEMTEAEFSQFVVRAETAISREHTLWRARRVGK